VAAMAGRGGAGRPGGRCGSRELGESVRVDSAACVCVSSLTFWWLAGCFFFREI
jgi:hypothetical protein